MSDLDSHEDEKSMLRIADDMNLSDIRIQKRWVSAEDEAIRRHVQTNGEDNWAAVSLCLYRWKESLNPKIRKGYWSAEEDAKLISLVNELGTEAKHWTEISARLGTRTRAQCMNRWKVQLDPAIKKGQWTAEEDALILARRHNHSMSWIEIAKMLEHRCDADVRNRYLHLVRPKVDKPLVPRPWTPEEDELLRKLVKEYAEGNWEAVTRHFPGRSLFQVHRRWNDYLVKPQLKTGPWSTEEDAQLVSLVQQHGGKWTLVAQYMDGRHANHCRQRYSYKLNPELNHGDWSAQEDEIVLDRKNNFNMTWREIAVLLPGRCCAQVKQRYSILARPEGGKRKRRKTEKVKKKEGGMEGLAGGDSSSEDEGWQHDLLSAPVIRIVEEVQAEEENEVEVKEKPAKKPRGRAAGPAAANLATMAT